MASFRNDRSASRRLIRDYRSIAGDCAGKAWMTGILDQGVRGT